MCPPGRHPNARFPPTCVPRYPPGPESPLPRKNPLLLQILTLVLGAGVAVFAVASLAHAPWAATFSDTAAPFYALYAVVAGALTAADPALPGAVRRAWAAIAVAMAFQLAGDVAWFAQTWDGVEPEGATIADLFYQLQYPAFVVGLLFLPGRGRADSGRMLLDVVTVAVGALVVLWHEILGPTWDLYRANLFDLVVAAGPVVGDLAVLTAVATVLFRDPMPPTRAALALLSAGFFVWVGSDLAYLYASQRDAYASGSPIDIGWIGAVVLFGAAAMRQRTDQSVTVAVAWADVAVAWTARLLPYFGMALGMGMLLGIAGERSEGVARVTVVGAAGMCALILLRQTLAALQAAELNRALEDQNQKLIEETDKSERLLLNILPAAIASKLKHGRSAQPVADRFGEVTVMFADIVGFTALSASLSPEQLLNLLDHVFVRFDALADRFGLEKIKTIGDAYMAVAGAPAYRVDHAEAAVAMALAMQQEMVAISAERGVDLALRIGIHTGPVVAGVIGQRKFSYDLWGDTVNTASRMESHGVRGRVQVSETTAARVKTRYGLEDRGVIEVKGKGPMRVWLVDVAAATP